MAYDAVKVWTTIERSLQFAAEAKRLTADARRLRQASEMLREKSAELLRGNSVSYRADCDPRNTPERVLIRKLRLREEGLIRKLHS
ncbi:MAG TPA: hypothetical protein VJM50_19345 [Pyrinomonadaceae bacterium]|nr:hypothetical protein [Pyrinomonadaceae bacterium]